jgi:hypothetical protein
MVTDALWTDFNTDGRVDLIVVGEFMAVRFFENTGDGFDDVTGQTGLKHTAGWWNGTTDGDFDEDSDTDYVVGNLGSNTRCEASPSEPVSIYAGDFDQNGVIAPLLAHYVQGREVPVPRRNRFLTQLPSLQQQFPSYESYATATVSDLLSERQRERATILRATRFASSYLENQGDGQFRIRDLPTHAQLGPLYGLIGHDVTGNGHLDVLAAGNSYAPDVITGRHDALIGVLLEGDGTGQFESVSHQESGFFVDGNGKGLAQLYRADGTPLYVATQNDDSTRVFTHNEGQRSHTVFVTPTDTYATIHFSDGSRQRYEIYYGGGYLSQSSRRLTVPPEADSVRVYTYEGVHRTISPSPSAQD